MKIAISEVDESVSSFPPDVITAEEVREYTAIWNQVEVVQNKFDELRGSLIPRFKKGAVCERTEEGITLAFKNYMSKSTKYKDLLDKVREYLRMQADVGKPVMGTQLLGLIEQWYGDLTTESERNSITPKAEQVVTVTKAVKIQRGV